MLRSATASHPVRAQASEPAVMTAGARYARAPGQLFVHGIHASDVMQGSAGDCYFLSALASLARSHPGQIQQAIHKRPDGQYAVRFFARQPDGSFKPQTVVVDGKLPQSHGRLVYARDRDHGERWVSLMEKAYAKWRGSYGKIGHGGYGTEALSALTGRPASFSPLGGKSEAEVVGLIRSALANKGEVMAATSDKLPGRPNATGLVGSHFYSVLGLEQHGGVQYVVLRNPWGNYEPKSKLNGGNDGVFRLPLSKFRAHFTELDWAH